MFLSHDLPLVANYIYPYLIEGVKEMVENDGANYDRFIRAFNSHKKFLQLLSYQMGPEESKNPKRWVLKCPLHLFWAREISETYPDAKLIW
jgi:hypothetical protein